jgi:hypothetical protein
VKAWARADLVVLLLALGTGAALRADRLGVEELTTDEAFSWRMSTYAPAEIVARTASDVHPPLYYLVLAAWTGVWGDSPVALRTLSTIFGLGAVVLAFLVCREADRWAGEAGRRMAGPGAAAAVLVAVHGDQVTHSRHARMYAMGGFLAGLSAWLLLRALRSQERFLAWWVAYAVAAAALCYTHYYGAFTVTAQLLFAAIALARRWRSSPQGRSQRVGWASAVVLASLLYAPWLSVLRRQTARVSEQYWIGDVGPADIATALVRWATGAEWFAPVPLLAIALFVAGAVAAAWRGDRGQRFFAMQAALPWLGALGLSLLARRPLFLERYLFFSQFALLAAVGYGWSRMTAPWPKRAFAAVLASLVALGLVQEIGGRPAAPAAAQEAARFLAREVPPRDLVLANAPRDLLVLRYYLQREGPIAFPLECPASKSEGHLSQVAAIAPDEIVADDQVWADRSRKVWRVRLHPPRRWRPEPPPPDWSLGFSRLFEGPASTRLLVMVYEPVM